MVNRLIAFMMSFAVLIALVIYRVETPAGLNTFLSFAGMLAFIAAIFNGRGLMQEFGETAR